jgi:hypothetical protein
MNETTCCYQFEERLLDFRYLSIWPGEQTGYLGPESCKVYAHCDGAVICSMLEIAE